MISQYLAPSLAAEYARAAHAEQRSRRVGARRPEPDAPRAVRRRRLHAPRFWPRRLVLS